MKLKWFRYLRKYALYIQAEMGYTYLLRTIQSLISLLTLRRTSMPLTSDYPMPHQFLQREHMISTWTVANFASSMQKVSLVPLFLHLNLDCFLIPIDFDPSMFKCERLQVKGHDGASIPLTLVHKKDISMSSEYTVCILFLPVSSGNLCWYPSVAVIQP